MPVINSLPTMSIGIRSLLAQAKILVMFLMSWGVNKHNVTPPQQPPAVVQTGVEPQVPCYFVFGDSLSDSGNNNALLTTAKANYYPYGVDFAGGVATGRFTNNKTFVDVITELLGFDHFIPPFNPTMGVEEASEGVNYASGGAGILYETSRLNLGDVISFYQQIQNHQSIVEKIGDQVNLTQCLYTINIGSDDYINNYFDNETYPTSQILTPTQFASLLTAHYQAYTKMLYGLGARKIVFYLLTEIGCALGEMAANNATACVESIDDAVKSFNNKLVRVVADLIRELPDAQFIYFNSTAVDVTTASTGITVFNESCCTTRSDGQCSPDSTICSNRSEYYFWDLYHPTDAAVEVFGAKAYKADSTDQAFPFDISTLVQL